MKYIFLLCSLLMTASISAQNTYYKIGNGKPMSQDLYDGIKKKLSANGVVEESFIKTATKKDSVIKTVKLSIKEGTLTNHYAAFEKNIGKKFPIEKFKDSKGATYKPDALAGKPTFINFWFTRCPPCIEEIPMLNSLQKKFGDKVNFIAITFDDKATVNTFLKKKKINFDHITDAKLQLGIMEVQAYPMNVMLDKNGNVVKVTGDIIDNKKEISDYIHSLL